MIKGGVDPPSRKDIRISVGENILKGRNGCMLQIEKEENLGRKSTIRFQMVSGVPSPATYVLYV